MSVFAFEDGDDVFGVEEFGDFFLFAVPDTKLDEAHVSPGRAPWP